MPELQQFDLRTFGDPKNVRMPGKSSSTSWRAGIVVPTDLLGLKRDKAQRHPADSVEALKADPATWHIPVVFLTADKHVEERTRALVAKASS